MTSRLEGFKNRWTARGFRMLAAALLVLGAQSIASQADALTLVGRETILNGFAVVGYATVGYNSGFLDANDGGLTSSYTDVLTDSGAANGEYQGRPVSGVASFSAAQAFNVGPTGITASGEAGAQTTAAYEYMSAGARATSTLELIFTLDAATPFSLGGALITGGTPAPATVQLSCLSACSSEFWRFTSTGAFHAAGTLNAGTWLLYANAGPASVDSNVLRLASFDLALAVPEPKLATLLGVGLGGLAQLARRRRSLRGSARPVPGAVSIARSPRLSGSSNSSILSAPHRGQQRKLSMTSRLDGFRNGSKTGRIALAQSIQLLALSAIPALASDGVLEINQTCAVQTGCFAGDTATYPVTISASGSYQLTSNLIIPSLNTTGILISASDVEIDLNGFSIIGAACVGATTNCTPTALALGIGIDQSPNSLFGMSVRNGSIMGMGWYGLSAGNQATIDGVRTRWNRSTGIIALEGATVLKSVAYQNGGSGITTGVGSTLSNNTSNGNGGIGISCNFGSTATGNTAFDNSGTGLASFGKSTLSRNTARRNGGTGISAGNGSTVSGNTVSESGSDGIVVGRDSMVLGNSATFNTGFGLNIGDGSGYRENMVAGLSAAGTVTGTGLNLGANVCNSVVCP